MKKNQHAYKLNIITKTQDKNINKRVQKLRIKKKKKNLNWCPLFCFFIVNFLWHNILYANSKWKNNKWNEFIRLKYKCELHLGKKVRKKKKIQQRGVYCVGFNYMDNFIGQERLYLKAIA